MEQVAKENPNPSSFASKAKDLEALRSAVVDAASVGAGLWLSYLFVLFYLAIAVGSVTHRDLLFEKAVKLPFLNVELPLTAFFVIGPGLFLIVHAYVLLHFMLLADKAGAFHQQLKDQIEDADVRSRLRRQLPSNIFVQYVAGPPEIRSGVLGFLFRSIAEISLVYLPIALLVLFQLQFLAYHSHAITWWHRAAILIELTLVWTLWPSIARGEISRLGVLTVRSRRVGVSITLTTLTFVFIAGIATFPGEWLNQNVPSIRIIPTRLPWSGANEIPPPPTISHVDEPGLIQGLFYTLWDTIEYRLDLMARRSLYDLLIAGEVDPVGRKPTSIWSNRLVLTELDTSAASNEVLSLRGRHLEGAVFLFARMPNADFTGAHLQEALLDGADLRGAQFGCGAIPRMAGGDRSGDLDDFDEGKREGQCTELQLASLRHARLQGATFDGADLKGADFFGALLHGASIRSAAAQGAFFRKAELHAAMLDNTNFTGAVLSEAEFYGASLFRTILSSATLDRTQLQGARFFVTSLTGTTIFAAFTWRTTPPAFADGATPPRVSVPNSGAEYEAKLVEDCPEKVPQSGRSYYRNPCRWSVAKYEALKRSIQEGVLDAERRTKALQRIEVLNPSAPADEERGAESKTAWEKLVSASSEDNDIRAARAKALSASSCESGGAYVIRLLLWNSLYAVEQIDVARLILKESYCPGLDELSRSERRSLERIASDK